MRRSGLRTVVAAIALGAALGLHARGAATRTDQPSAAPQAADPFRQDNLVAWCVVPFDAKNRAPAERAEMLARLGFKKFAYDWRGPHLPTFDAEVQELKKRNIELTAVWFPAALNAEARQLLEVVRKHSLKTQLGVT